MESKDLVNEEKEELLALLLKEEGFGILPEQVIAPQEKKGGVPLSFAQQRLWILDQLEPGNTSYTIPLTVRLRGSLHLAALEHGLNEIIRRHEALRTIFTEAEDQPVQIVVQTRSLLLPMADLSGFTIPEQEIEVRRLLTEEDQQPFDLSHGPLIRASLLRLGAEEHPLLPIDLSERLKALSSREQTTPFMTLLAAFKVLLLRYTGQEDIVVGTPVAGRNRSEIEHLIGFFLNTLVLRTDLSGNPSFLEVLERVRKVTVDAYAHQDVPFEHLLQVLQIERSLSYTPLFQVVFVLQNAPHEILELANLQLEVLPIESATTKFDLTLQMAETEQGLRGILEYNTDLFEAATISRMLKHFQKLLGSIVAHPEQPVAGLPLLSQAEQEQLLVGWNEFGRPATEPWCIHELFEKQVECQPAAVALVWEEEQITYEVLNRRANQLTHHLRRLGVGPERRVGVCLRRSPDLVVGLLAILKAGGSYVPLDPAYPRERLAFILKDAQVAVLLAHQSLIEGLPQQEACVVYLDADGGTIDTEPNTALVSKVNWQNVAYVIYTSGSTGQPKGVLISHVNVIYLLAATQPRFDFDHRDVWSLFHSSAFDFSVWELWGALLYGGRLIVVSYEVSRSPEAFADLLYRQRVSVLNQTPSAFRQLLPYQQKMKGGRVIS